MASYQHILIGLDLSKESVPVLEKAVAIANAFSAKVSLAHVVEPIVFAYGGDVAVDLTVTQEMIVTQANKKLEALAEQFNLENAPRYTVVGDASTELHNLSEDNNADLIIVGSHGRHGVALLLGSTANGVLHGAKCDVLAVRI